LDNVTGEQRPYGRGSQPWRGPSVVVLLSQARCCGWPEGARLVVAVPQAAHGARGWL
jgi:hypothetical protein